jgi:hypothetical protein
MTVIILIKNNLNKNTRHVIIRAGWTTARPLSRSVSLTCSVCINVIIIIIMIMIIIIMSIIFMIMIIMIITIIRIL